jgi:hypothetical protein
MTETRAQVRDLIQIRQLFRLFRCSAQPQLEHRYAVGDVSAMEFFCFSALGLVGVNFWAVIALSIATSHSGSGN